MAVSYREQYCHFPPAATGNNKRTTREFEFNSPPLLAIIGPSPFFLAFALVIILAVSARRVKRRRSFSHGPASSNNEATFSSSSLVAPCASANRQEHIQLLPSSDKLDMRSVYSSSGDKDVERDNYAHENTKEFNRWFFRELLYA